jgi:hypothetical protein
MGNISSNLSPSLKERDVKNNQVFKTDFLDTYGYYLTFESSADLGQAPVNRDCRRRSIKLRDGSRHSADLKRPV